MQFAFLVDRICSWFHGFLGSERAKKRLLGRDLPEGSYLVRFSESRAKDFGLTISSVSAYENRKVLIEYPCKLEADGSCNMWIVFVDPKKQDEADVVTKVCCAAFSLENQCSAVQKFQRTFGVQF